MAGRLGIIGAGTMGSAIVRGAAAAAVLEPQAIVVSDVDPDRLEALRDLGCRTSTDPAAAAACEQILLAVKPQSFSEVAGALAPLGRPTVVISIMAGLGSAAIRAALGPAHVVRVMPNTPARVRAGMTAISLGAGAEPGDETLAVALFAALGRTVMVDEADMHAVTAVSGSGPAYVFLLAEAMEAAARDAGLDAATAALLVRQTVLGAATLLAGSGEDPGALRRAVTSPGGTTEAALAAMGELPGIVAAAVKAARERGMELEGGK